jgi:hypothetical protein
MKVDKHEKLSRVGFIALLAAAILVFGTGCAAEKKLNAGDVWVVTETTSMEALHVGEGAQIKAPEGKSVTLTVDGVETGIGPGRYEGDIVLTVTEEIPITFRDFPEPHIYRTAVYIEDGKFIPEKSVSAAVAGGTVTDTTAENVKITSVGENFNGIMATGDSPSTYAITAPDIDFTGSGGNDFAGWGAAIMSSGKAEVVVKQARIVSRGAVRTAVWAGGSSTMRVYDSDIEVFDGVLPADYTFSADPGKMKEVPWMLGITGNCRATNVVDGGKAYYQNTRVKAQAWGVLSTDGTRGGVLNVTDCTIETVESGYGAYADGSVTDTFSGCTFNVNDYGLIMTGGEGVFTDGSVVNSGRFGVMFHGSATLDIDKGCVFNTGKAVLQVKSAFPTIRVDGAVLNPKNGIILESMLNDDPLKAAMPGGGIPGRGEPAGGMPPQAGMPDGGMPGVANSTDITATFRNVSLSGDIVHAMTSLADMIVRLENVSITGVISTSKAKDRAGIDGVELGRETCGYIGEIEHALCASGDDYGLKVSLDGKTRWQVNDTSFMTALSISKGAVISSPDGFSVTLMVDGRETPITPGVYEGKIELLVANE